MNASTSRPPVLGPAARMRCWRCGRVFSMKPGHVIAHDRLQGCVWVRCDGALVADVRIESADGAERTGMSS